MLDQEVMQKGRDRPKKYYGEVTKQDITQLRITDYMNLDRKE